MELSGLPVDPWSVHVPTLIGLGLPALGYLLKGFANAICDMYKQLHCRPSVHKQHLSIARF